MHFLSYIVFRLAIIWNRSSCMYRLRRASQLDLAGIVHVEDAPCYILRGGLWVEGEEEVGGRGVVGEGGDLCICKYTQWAQSLAGRVCNPEFIIQKRLLGLHLAMRGRGEALQPPPTRHPSVPSPSETSLAAAGGGTGRSLFVASGF